MQRTSFSLAFLLLLSACGTKKSIQTIGPKATISLKSEIQEWPSPWWSAKAKLAIKGAGSSPPIIVTMRAEEGKAIWFSASALGLVEVARGLIKEDSLLLLDKFNHRCIRTKFSDTSGFLPVRLELKQIQHFLMGRVFWDSLNSAVSRSHSDTIFLNGKIGEVGYAASLQKRFQLLQAKAEFGKGNELKLVNEDFRPVSGFPVAFYKEVEGSSATDPDGFLNSRFTLEFTRFDFLQEAPDLEFSLPDDCEPMRFK